MHAKLAGHLSLHDMITSVIDDSRIKLAADEKKEEKKDDKDKKPNPFSKKKDDEKGEKKEASANIDLSNPDEVEKLASALEFVGEKMASTYTGGESPVGGETLPVTSTVGGKQSYKKDSSKAHGVPMTTGLQAGDKGGPAPTQVPNNHAKAPGGPAYPKKGVLKTAAEGVMDKIKAMKGKKDEGDKDDKKEDKEKKSAAVTFILDKMAESVEKRMGGETLDSKSGDGPKPPSQPGRQLIANNAAPAKATKKDAKTGTTKKLMAEVLTEPAMSKAHDSKVHDNLRNATKGGVKIAAAKAFLQKISEEGCTCEGKDECKYCNMKKSLEKKSTGMMNGAC